MKSTDDCIYRLKRERKFKNDTKKNKTIISTEINDVYVFRVFEFDIFFKYNLN